MSSTSPSRPDFVPIESIIAFAFIGVMVFVGLIARCLAMNHSTTRSAQSLDLMIYRAAPRPAPVAKAKPSSAEPSFDTNGENRDHRAFMEDAIAPSSIQRGPKNL